MPHQQVIKVRRSPAAVWASRNPILADGEPGYESDTRRIKFGDGWNRWNNLPYVGTNVDLPDTEVSSAELFAHIQSSAPHPVYDNIPDLVVLYNNAKV